jgi:hypothetical protein
LKPQDLQVRVVFPVGFVSLNWDYLWFGQKKMEVLGCGVYLLVGVVVYILGCSSPYILYLK